MNFYLVEYIHDDDMVEGYILRIVAKDFMSAAIIAYAETKNNFYVYKLELKVL